MANEKIIFDTEVKVGSSVGSVKSLKAELRAVTNELGQLEYGSEAFVKAASRAGELKDQIGDVKNTIASFNPEAKFQALASVVGIAANGFSALQGGMALFGSESEDLQKVMAKTQGAIALATGLNGLLGMKDAFKDLGLSVIKMIPALNSMGAAMLGAITGGVAIALVLIISYWKDLKLMITGTIDEVKLSSKEVEDAVKKGHEEFKKAADERNSIKEREAKLKLKGKDLDLELAKIEKQRKIDEAIASGKLASEKKLIEDEYLKSVSDINKKYQDENIEKQKTKKEKDEKILKDKESREKKFLEDQKKQQEDLIARTEKEYNDTNKFTDEFYKKKELALVKSGATEEEIKKGQQQIEIANLEQKIQNAKDYGQSTVDFELELENKKTNIKKEEATKQADINKKIAADETKTAEERYAALNALAASHVISEKEASDAKIAIAQAEQNAKLSLLAAYGQTFNQIADLLGKSTAEGKAVAIAATTIDTYVAAFRAYKEGLKLDPTGTFSIIAAAAAVAAGIAAVQNIVNTPVPGNNGGGGGGGGITAPSAPRIPQSFTGTKLGGNSEVITKGNGQVQKVIVTETDITKTQDKVKGIIRKATIR
jgi:hypothetical protein